MQKSPRFSIASMWAAGGGRARGAAGHASIHRTPRGRVGAPSQKGKAARLASVCGEAHIKSTAGRSDSLAGGSDVSGNEAINLVPVLRCSAASGIQLPCAEWGLLLSASEEPTPGSPPRPITLTSPLSELAGRAGEAAGTSLLSPRAWGAPSVLPSRPGLSPCTGGGATQPAWPLPSPATSGPTAAAPAGPAPASAAAHRSAPSGRPRLPPARPRLRPCLLSARHPPPARSLSVQLGLGGAPYVCLPLLSRSQTRSRRNGEVLE